MNTESKLPSKETVKATFGTLAQRITLRNNQYIVTVSLNDSFKAMELAGGFGFSNTLSKHPFVKINIA